MNRALVILVACVLLVGIPLGASSALAEEDCSDDDPDCEPKDEPSDEKKEICTWTVNGAPAPPNNLILVPRGAQPGPQTVVLDCPNHILEDWACSYKHMEPGLGDDTFPTEPECQFLGETQVEDPCRTVSTWEVMAPNLNTYTMSLEASTWKDADCDGEPDDWNTSKEGDDGLHCELPNEYGAKTDTPWFPYEPTPDGELNECDQQHYEIQWRQWN